MKKLRLFIVDDHAVFRAGLRMLIHAQPDMEVVGEAGDGQEALQRVQDLLPDVVIMDVAMLHVDGAQATERLAHLCPTARVLALTAYEEVSRVRQLLQAGAAGYLLKRVAADELTHAIRIVATGGTYLDPTIAASVVDGYLRPPPSPADVLASPLSTRESEVLRLLAWGHSNKEIAVHLSVSVKTVETYKTRLMDKLHLRSRVDLVRYAVQQGWLQEP
jgi:DNA-binding NarL/FixJ family response regulator